MSLTDLLIVDSTTGGHRARLTEPTLTRKATAH